MDLFHHYLVDYLTRIMSNNMRIRFIGDRTGLSEKMQEEIYNLERESVYNTGLQFTIALNYGSRDEIFRAVKRMIADGHHDPAEFSEKMLGAYLDTADMPDPDLLIRTSGEERLSNFMLWQLAYSEFVFTPVLWPDFTRKDLIDAVRIYSSRSRRYGGV
jgi:undecaprenyl diphosphate synthase